MGGPLATGERVKRRWWLWLLCAGFTLVLGACGADDGDTTGGSPPRETSRVDGFGEIAFRVRPAGTSIADDTPEFCALHADTEERWRQGLTNRRDLAGYEGMIFRFDRDVDTAFHMRDTPMPLTIAWFDANGAFVSSADMDPCLNQEECPRYRAPRPYRYAIEVPRGALGRLKIAPNAVIDVGGACPAAT